MKKYILALVAVATLGLQSCKDNEAPKIDEANLTAAAAAKESSDVFPVMTFEEESYDFGTVDEGTIVEHEFTFKNTGKAPLIVVDAKSTCGCTVPTWSKKPIAPGESGTMLVKFNTNGKPDAQTKPITITANTESGMESIKVTGMVTPKDRTSPNA